MKVDPSVEQRQSTESAQLTARPLEAQIRTMKVRTELADLDAE